MDAMGNCFTSPNGPTNPQWTYQSPNLSHGFFLHIGLELKGIDDDEREGRSPVFRVFMFEDTHIVCHITPII